MKIPALVFLRDQDRGHFSVVRGIHPRPGLAGRSLGRKLFAIAIMDLMSGKSFWEGTATELLTKLTGKHSYKWGIKGDRPI